jgi:hypothetical protein
VLQDEQHIIDRSCAPFNSIARASSQYAKTVARCITTVLYHDANQVDDDSWLFVEDELFEPKEMAGLGWAMSLLHRGYKVVVRYAGEVVDGEG